MSGTGSAASPMALPERMQRVFPEGGHALARSEAELFYGIALPEGEAAVAEGGEVFFFFFFKGDKSFHAFINST